MNIDDKIFAFAYTMAFRDATMRNAFLRHEGEDDIHYHSRKQKVMDLSREPVRKYISGIFYDKKPDPIKTIISICNEQYGFTFGNAQKLVNMTAKYMFITTFMDDDKKKKFEKCDCPMDSIMLSVVRTMKPNVSWKADYSWSRMTDYQNGVPDVYMEFQESVKKLAKEMGMLPIEFDYKYWDE